MSKPINSPMDWPLWKYKLVYFLGTFRRIPIKTIKALLGKANAGTCHYYLEHDKRGCIGCSLHMDEHYLGAGEVCK